MDLKNRIQEDLKIAFKSQNQAELSAVKYLISLIKNEEIDSQQELSDETITKLIRQEVTKRKEAIRLFQTAGRDALVKEEEEKLQYLLRYLPKMLGESELKPIIEKIIAEHPGEKNFGLLMKEALVETTGQADGSEIAALLKTLLASKLKAKS